MDSTDSLSAQNPAEIWTSLALLNLLRAPLMMLPNSLSTMTDALSALTNLVPVFVAEELPEKLFEVDENAELALEVRDATFGWETSPPPASGAKGSKGKSGKKASKAVAAEMTEKDDSPSRLEDINLRVPRGQLLCIVGSVGLVHAMTLQRRLLLPAFAHESFAPTNADPANRRCCKAASARCVASRAKSFSAVGSLTAHNRLGS